MNEDIRKTEDEYIAYDRISYGLDERTAADVQVDKPEDTDADMNRKNKGSSSGESAVSFFKSLIIDVLIAVLLASLVLYFIRPTVVKQSSMENTLHENDYMILYRQAYRSHGPERGDIIIFESDLFDEDSGTDKLLIKRAIGLPGDKIMIEDGELYINGQLYEEDYLKDGYTPAFEIPEEGETFTVPEDNYFVMGDNRVGSVDSRREEVGCVSSDKIKGKVVLRLFPFNKIQRF